jgi:hypothetical protein
MQTPRVDFPGVTQPHEDILATRTGIRTRPFFYDLDLSIPRSNAAGTAVTLALSGNTFYADQNPNDGTCVAHFQDQSTDNSSTPFYITPGFISQIPFTQVTFENPAQPGKKIRIIYGQDLQFTPNLSSQIQIAGNVNVVDSGKSRTLLNLAFLATVGISTANPNFGAIQLWNPPGTGKNLILESWNANVDVAQLIIASDSNAVINAGGAINPSSKKLGGAVSSATILVAALAVAPAGARLHGDYDAIKNRMFVSYKEPVVIPPGRGFVVWAADNTLTTTLYADFEYFEDPV